MSRTRASIGCARPAAPRTLEGRSLVPDEDQREVTDVALSEPTEVLRVLASRLDACGVAYMLSGSTALNYYAQPRMTRDIDVVIELEPAAVARLVESFVGDFYIDGEAVREAALQKGMFNLIHLAYMLKVDFIVRKDSPYRRTEFERRRRVTFEGQVLSIVAPEDLLLSKLHWAKDSRSEMQIRDARNLVECVSDLDWPYLERWSQDLGVADLLLEVRL